MQLERSFGLPGRGDDRGPHAILSFVAADPAHPWTLSELAEIAGCSQGHLVRRFRRAGLGAPMNAVKRQRLSRAAALLQARSHHLSDIAETVDYARSFSPSRAFKQAYSRSPQRYRAHYAP